MHRAFLSLLVLAACSAAPREQNASQLETGSASCTSAPVLAQPSTSARRDSLDDALAQIGLNRGGFSLSSAAIDQNGLMPSRDPRRLADLDAFGRSPLGMIAWGNGVARALDDASVSEHPVSDSLSFAQARRANAGAAPPSPTCTTVALVDTNDPQPLATALDTISAMPVDWSGVPLDLQRALVPVVLAMAHASEAVADARSKVSPFLAELNAVPSWLLGSYKLALRPELTSAMETFDVESLIDAARGVSLAIEGANLERFRGTKTAHVEAATKFGAIVISGSGNDTFSMGSLSTHAWLLVDTAGDDTYDVPAGGAYFDQGVSIAIDLGGDDTYGYDEVASPADGAHMLPSDAQGRVMGQTRSRVPRQGGAVLGIGMSFDLGGGNDHRRSLALSQGSAVLGVGVSYDDGGDDVYEAEVFSQGASAWGVGLLLDAAGDDRYSAYRQAQGFGGVRGAGLLVDAAGNDRYATDSGVPALGGDPLYPSAQLPGASNESFSQGCGAGRRPDEPDVGFPFPGGVGVLRDRAGNDSYAASVIAQGCGFAMGMGALLDGAGNDSYDALYYAQGAALHLSAAVMVESGGDDRYDTIYPANAAALGLGHDVSTGAMLDLGGDDVVRAPAMSAGVGSANGLGLMVMTGGSDAIDSKSTATLGVANPASPLTAWRTKEKTAGVFVHAASAAKYTGERELEPNGTQTHTDGMLDSVGLDRPAGSFAP